MAEGDRTEGQQLQGYRGPQACKITGISYRQLDYWARTGLVTPSLQKAKGSGSQRLYSFRDLVHLRVIKSLLDAGVNLPQIRKAIRYLDEQLNAPLEEVTLLSDGNTVYAVTEEKEIIDLVRRGQGVIGIFLGGVFEDLKGSLRELLPTPEPATSVEPTSDSAAETTGS